MDPTTVATHRLTNLMQTGVILGGMALILALLGWTILGSDGIVWTMIAGSLMVLLTPRLSPRVLLRLYRARELDPYQARQLYQLVARLAQRAELPTVPRLYYLPSRTLNAFTVGRARDAVIGITDGLLRSLDFRELAGVLAHEISHIRHNDMWVMGLADMVSRLTSALSVVGQVLLVLSVPLLLFGDVEISWFPILLLIVAPALSTGLQMGLSRTREYDADLGAAELTADPEGLASALLRIDRGHGSSLQHLLFPGGRNPQPSMLRTHPPTSERVERLLALSHSHGAPTAGFLQEPRSSSAASQVLPYSVRPPRRHWHGLWY